MVAATTGTAQVDVRFQEGEAYEIRLGEHTVVVDQPVDAGGNDTGPTPTELFVASLAACVAFYGGRYLTRHGLSRHGLSRDGLRVTASFDMATDRPARVAAIRLTLHLPDGVPDERRPALRAVAAHCTVHNSIVDPPEVTLDLV
jgi:putative redox protein